jgi:hypothetical protein
MGRRELVDRRDAFSSALSAVLVLMITTSSVGTVLFVGVETVETLSEENTGSRTEKQLCSVSENLIELTNSREGDSKLIKFGLDQDVSMSIDNEKDRTVLMYSLDPEYEFTVSGLDDKDYDFNIFMQSGHIDEVKIFWLDFFDTCFLAGSKILMADESYKKIENVNIGDYVKSYNEITGGVEDCKVVDVFHHTPDEMPDYYLVINDNLKVTPNHRFYSDGEWIYAGNLKIGDFLFDYNENEFLINSIEEIYNRVPTYDLEIENCHNYFVSISEGVEVLVHNNFGSGIGPPSVQTNDASDIDSNSAKLNGLLTDDGGESCQIRFRYKKAGIVLIDWTYLSDWQGSYNTGQSFFETVGSLEPNTEYIFEAGAKNTEGEVWGSTISFTTNNPPNTPTKPSGETDITVDTLFLYSTSATDQDSDQVQYRFDWDVNGLHDYSYWTSLGPSGHTGTLDHDWDSPGDYVVKAQAKDSKGDLSGWSEGLTVTVTKINNPPDPCDQPKGPSVGYKNVTYQYTTSTNDSDGDQLYYWFDWGDGSNSGWIGPYMSRLKQKIQVDRRVIGLKIYL